MTCTVQVKLLDSGFNETTVIIFKVQVDGKNVPTAVKVLSKHRVLDVSLGASHSAALVEPGLVYTFGDNQMGQLACGNCKPRDVPAIVKALEDKTTAVRKGSHSSEWCGKSESQVFQPARVVALVRGAVGCFCRQL